MSDYLDPTVTNDIELCDCRGRILKPGDMVILIGGHPHAGRLGQYMGVDVLATGKGAAKVDFGSDGCYVFNAGQWEKWPNG